MTTTPLPSDQLVTKTVTIKAPAARVWAALTDPVLMPQWMAESPIEIITDWMVGSPIVIRGELHGINFVNDGKVLACEPEQRLTYTQLSSISELPDVPENYAVVSFFLTPEGADTGLTVTVRNFATTAIYKHLAFYWPVALGVCKRFVEQQGPT